ncbi:SMI1/KNR4 family protein [Saccharibacillus sacchari]|uniref:SMI1/KNR4 family protein n=1 Tax=Saccharibacillus sacchari TaxID=456493 RepID=A0ACC6P794_9BACL
MNTLNIPVLIERLRILNITLDPGLTQEEIQRAEQEYSISFPPDLRELLQQALPYGESFPDWRNLSSRNIKRIRERLNQPLEGVLFDIEHSGFWPDRWGTKPPERAQARAAAEQHLQLVPKLIPIRGHRYLPATPHQAGNPVFSVHQTDVIPYGENLADYFEIEFRHKRYEEMNVAKIKPIDFWGELG